jgi:hypothetical protein
MLVDVGLGCNDNMMRVLSPLYAPPPLLIHGNVVDAKL